MSDSHKVTQLESGRVWVEIWAVWLQSVWEALICIWKRQMLQSPRNSLRGHIELLSSCLSAPNWLFYSQFCDAGWGCMWFCFANWVPTRLCIQGALAGDGKRRDLLFPVCFWFLGIDAERCFLWQEQLVAAFPTQFRCILGINPKILL